MALEAIKKHITTDQVLDLYSGVGTIGLSVARNHHLTLVEIDKSAFRELCKNITAEDLTRLTRSGMSEVSPVTTEQRSERNSNKFEFPSKAVPSRKAQTGANERVRSGNIVAELTKAEDATNYIEPDMTVIVDPPRAGCDKKLINRLLEVTPEKIIYLSCNPATQARDTKLLLDKYHIEEIKTFNFFPHTPHIENLLILTRK